MIFLSSKKASLQFCNIKYIWDILAFGNFDYQSVWCVYCLTYRYFMAGFLTEALLTFAREGTSLCTAGWPAVSLRVDP